ncbi:hypothetical protein [Streptomyces sp. NPDC001165]|uniref:hypothetical protein n=1 Tax=Streptomyces sp. NPDC001165 TaxID=3364546 RepID=UPI0036A7E605
MMHRRTCRWLAVAGLALPLAGCVSTGETTSGTPSTPTPTALSCGEAIYYQAGRELSDASDRDHAAAYQSCEGLTTAQVDGLINKSIGRQADHLAP